MSHSHHPVDIAWRQNRNSVGRALVLILGLVASGAEAQIHSFTGNNVLLTNVFGGTVLLDGDIGDFFQTNGTAAKAGVVVQDDANGLDESPVAELAARDGVRHPSGFNQRRILAAFNPSISGGTLFVGIDLPGGSGANHASRTTHSFPGNPNPNYFDGVVGGAVPGWGRGKIVPFDADANGEADLCGRNATSGPLFRCTTAPSNVLDIWNCSSSAAMGATDNPRASSGEVIGARENYVVSVLFDNGQTLTAELSGNTFTPAGMADAGLSSSPAAPFGVRFSTDTGATGVPLGFDVEAAITNMNMAVPDLCARLHFLVVVDSGSNRDGASQGEDQNLLECTYILPASLAVTKSCPPTPTAPGELLVFTGTVRNAGQVPLTEVCVTNTVVGITNRKVFGPAALVPGQVAAFTNSYFVPRNYRTCATADTLIATGFDCTDRRVVATSSTACPIRNCLSVALAMTPAATNLVIRWAGDCAFEQTDDLLGGGPATVWTTVPGHPVSPYTVDVAQARRFYRLRDCP